jgi:flagellar biosynthesis protein FliR
MIILNDDFLMQSMSAFLLLSVRISAFFLVAPVFSASAVTVPIRIAIMMGLAFALMSTITVPNVDLFSPSGVTIVAREAVIGISIGILFQIAFASVAMAGEHIASSMGLGFASMVDPQTGAQSVVVTQFMSIMMILIFLVTQGHHILLRQLVASYKVAPIGGNLDPELFLGIMKSGALMFSAALIISLPAVVLLFLVNVLIGFMTRVAPQMNIFSVGFPVTILVGFVMVMISLPSMGNSMSGLLQTASGMVRDLILEDKALP